MVVGDRQVRTIEHFSPLKKSLQRLGSWVVRQRLGRPTSPTPPPASAPTTARPRIQCRSSRTSPTRSRRSSRRASCWSPIDHVPIRTNPKTRESRLFPSMWSYVRRNAVSIFRIYSQYEPLRVFCRRRDHPRPRARSRVWTRFFVAFIGGNGAGHVQSLILGAVLFNAAVVLAALGVIGDLLYAPAGHAAAHVRARPPHRAGARRRALALRAGSARHRPASAPPAPTPAQAHRRGRRGSTR